LNREAAFLYVPAGEEANAPGVSVNPVHAI
jgi:aerobic C4-dicarboxylate transport protein